MNAQSLTQIIFLCDSVYILCVIYVLHLDNLMKQVLIILSLALFSYVQLFNGMVWMNYEINKSEIIQKFCENKDKPELKCEGTCHMKKMMLDEGGEEGDEPLTILPEIQLFVENIGVELANEVHLIEQQFFYSDLYSYGIVVDIDIPPKS